MKYNCCNYLLHQIVFDIFDVKPCCEDSMNKEAIKFIENFEENKLNIEAYLEKRNILIEKFKEGNFPTACNNCPQIQKKDWNKEDIYFDRIIVANIAKCSCDCIYCVYTYNNPENKKKFNTRNPYDIKSILTDLKNKNYIKENFMLIIGGGECTEFDDGLLEWLIYFTISLNGRIQILSSGTNYSKAIEKILQTGKAELIISPDAGTNSTYKKIKRVNKFKNVWKNLDKYVKAAKNNKNAHVEIKYIIIPNINDSMKEFDSFLKMCKKINCKNIHLDIEHFWFTDNKEKEVPSNIEEILKHIKSKSEEFNVAFSSETQYWLDK